MTIRADSDQSLLEKTIDFYDPFLAWDRNRPENFLYGTWFENKFGIYKLPPGEYRFRFECVGAHPLSQSADGNGPGLNCRLDGISLRRFPWDDLHGQMPEYLDDEKTLFAARMNMPRNRPTTGANRRTLSQRTWALSGRSDGDRR